jgi:hypothetical protein
MVAELLTSLSNHINQPWGNHGPLALRRFLSLERRLRRSKQFEDYANVVNEYISSGHAERVPDNDLNKPSTDTVYLAPPCCLQRFSNNSSTCCPRWFNENHFWCLS